MGFVRRILAGGVIGVVVATAGWACTEDLRRLGEAGSKNAAAIPALRVLSEMLRDGKTPFFLPAGRSSAQGWQFDFVRLDPGVGGEPRLAFHLARGPDATPYSMQIKVGEFLRLNPVLARALSQKGIVLEDSGQLRRPDTYRLSADDPRGPSGDWRLYVVDHPGYPVDPKFGQVLHNAVTELVVNMRPDPKGDPLGLVTFPSVKDLSQFLATRQSFAFSNPSIGRPTKYTVETDLEGPRYEPWALKLLHRHRFLNPDQTLADLKERQVLKSEIVATTSDGTRVILGNWSFGRFPDSITRDGRRLSNVSGKFFHTDPKYQDAVYRHVDGLYHRLKKENLTEEGALSAVGEIYWWLAHLVPYERGSAANAHGVINAILLDLGYSVSPLKRGTVLDIEALSEPDVNRFKTLFPTFFVEPPRRMGIPR